MSEGYSKTELKKALDTEFVNGRKEIDVFPISKLREMLENGWIIYDTEVTSDKDIKILTLARIS